MKRVEAKFKTATVLAGVEVEVCGRKFKRSSFGVSFVAKLKLPTVVEATKRTGSATTEAGNCGILNAKVFTADRGGEV